MVNDIKETAKKRMDGVIDQLNTNLSSVRTGRANAMILDRVKADILRHAHAGRSDGGHQDPRCSHACYRAVG